MANLEKQLRNYRLTTAEIIYHLPDYHDFLQSYIWQELDLAPNFPALHRFLDFWERNLDGPLHSVKVTSAEIITPSDVRFYDLDIKLN